MQRKNETREECLERKRVYGKAYRSRPGARERRRAYDKIRRARPEIMEQIRAYSKAYNAKPETKERHRAHGRARYAKPEARKLIIAQNRAYRAKPDAKAKMYAWRTGISFEAALPWFLVPMDQRICCWCQEPANGFWCLDHDHDTMEIRGWAHIRCNSLEGRMAKSPRAARAIVESWNSFTSSVAREFALGMMANYP